MITDYIVSYTNGSGGHFLISMIERTVLNDNNFAPLKRGKFNDAHYATSVRNFRIDHKSIDSKATNTAEDEFFKASRIVPGKPVFIPTHVYWPSRQFEKWPNAKLAVVLHTEADMIDLAINGFYKTEMTEEWHDLQRNYKKVYFSPHNVVFEQVRNKHPLQFTPEDISYAVRTRVCMSIGCGYHFIKPITDDPRIHYIQYQDLVSSLDKLIEFVTEVTGKTPNDATIAEMIKYQTAQIDNMKRIKQELGL
jgi:hypothetical protein